MDLGLTGRAAWVTGASRGLGRAAATSLVREGARVAISARDPDRLGRAAEAIAAETGGECFAVRCDVSSPGEVATAAATVAARLGPVEILVANAGGPPPGGVDAVEGAGLRAAFELTLGSAFALARAVLPGMREAGQGVLLFVTSSSVVEALPDLLLSNMLRPGVVGLAKTISKERGRDGIRALCVAPGRHDTDRLRELDAAAAARSGLTVEEVRARSEAAIPAGAYGDPADFGHVVAFLASDRARYVSGVTILVDGGASAGY